MKVTAFPADRSEKTQSGMSQRINFYCDESCHLENDGHEVMILGALWCPADKRKEISLRLREIKEKHGIKRETEVKWVKASPNKLAFYLEWVDLFFDDDDINFRAVIIPNKSKLDHARYSQTHDEWYYKMLFALLHPLLKPENCHRIFLDKKDTRAAAKARKLHEVLSSSHLDFDRKIIQMVEPVASHGSDLLQLADILIGAVGYQNRAEGISAARWELVNRIKQRSHLSLVRSTLMSATKFNILRWEGGGRDV